MLFVPGDSERKQSRALTAGADALIFDLEDSVSRSQLPVARGFVAEVLRARPVTTPQLWVRVNAPGSGELLADLDAIVAGRPHGILLPKADAADVAKVGRYLGEAETRAGVAAGSIKLIVIAAENARTLLTANSYLAEDHPRLVGMTWGAEDLAASLGAAAKVDDSGEWTFTFQLARSVCLLTAAALAVQPIDTVHVAFRDVEGLLCSAAQARRDGFMGKLAIHPDQIEPINAAFTPSAAEIERARRVVEVFERSKDVGVLSLDGEMLDKPHLTLARHVLALAQDQSAAKPSTSSTPRK